MSRGDESYDAFDDEPVEDDAEYVEDVGFDDQPLERDPFDEAEAEAAHFAGEGEYDAAGAGYSSPLIRRRRGGSGGALAAGLFVLMMLAAIPLLGVAVVFIYLRQNRPPEPQREIVVGDRTIVVKRSRAPENVTWTEAGAGKAQKIRDLAVSVPQVSVGRVRARDETNRVVYSGDEYLRVDLEIESFRTEPFEYRTWYGREVEQFSGPERARLFDEAGDEIPPHVFGDVQDLEGHVETRRLDTRDSVRDVLYFELPQGETVESLGDLRLQLPLESPLHDTFFRFEIPEETIVREEPMPEADSAEPLSDEDLKALTGEGEDAAEPGS